MNKRLLAIYTVVFLLIGLMLYLYRSSYNAMRVYIADVQAIGDVIVGVERLDALLHFWMNNGPKRKDELDLYIPSDIAYDSILHSIDHLKNVVRFQEQRLRLDSLKRQVKSYQRLDEMQDPGLSRKDRENFRSNIKRIIDNLFAFSHKRLEGRKANLADATSLLDRWLVWMLVLAGSLITVATFYSFSFLHLRKKAESFSQTLLETTNNGIISFKPVRNSFGDVEDYYVTYCNDAALKILGITSSKHKKLSEIIPMSILDDIKHAFAEVIGKGSQKTIEGYLDIGKDRNWLQAAIAPLEEGVLVSAYNLNPVKLYEQKLTYKIKQLELANDELKQYAYVTSHDLQEPLRKIQMFSDIALNAKPGQENVKDEYFNRIIMSATRMRDLIQTLLMFTRSTDKPNAFAEVDLNKIVNKVLHDLHNLITDTKARVMVDELPRVEASEEHIELLFSNLLSNALKFSKSDVPAVVSVKTAIVSSAEYEQFPALDPMVRYVRISVHDNGVGFDQAMENKIFTIFQRLHNKEETAGVGIGLAICRKIVHQHHGFIYAKGVEGEGAVFYVFLPYQQPLDQD